LGGHRSKTIAIGTNHQPSRLRNLSLGDSAQHDVRGAYIWLTENGLVIDGAGLPATIRNCGTVTVEGDVHVTGDIVSRFNGAPVSLNALRDAYHAHKRGGVQAGSASTGLTDHDA
jgi:phage gp45-like